MKTYKFIFILLLAFGFAACEYDNYNPPAIKISGKLSCKGENFLYDGAGSKGLLKITQKGYGKEDSGIGLRVDENGEFTQLLFPGEYWMTLNNNKYPFELPDFQTLGTGLGYDSIYMNVTSGIQRDFEVIPYYIISDFSSAVEGGNIVLRATVTKNPDATRSEIPRATFVRGFVSTTAMVNSGTKCTKSARANINSESGTVEVSIPISGNATSYRGAYTYNTRNYGYCRLAIELENTPNFYLFSEIKKQEGIPLE